MIQRFPPIFLIWLGALVSACLFLSISASTTPLGFPLDDAWIHQVFARNLFEKGQFSYNPGQPVAGSTSPLWTILLVVGYFPGNWFYLTWDYLLGTLFLGLSAFETLSLYRLLFPNHPSDKRPFIYGSFAAAFLILFEWRLVWAAVSGMETLLFTFGTLWLVRKYLDTALNENEFCIKVEPLRLYALFGMAGGLLTLVRPEGMVLLGLLGLDVLRRKFIKNKTFKRKSYWLLKRWLLVLVMWLVPILPYLFFNYWASGSPLPTTFYAKAKGYGTGISIGAFFEYGLKALPELLGRGPLLFVVPGYAVAFNTELRERGYLSRLLPLIWPLVVLLLYAVQLPVTYQHGRYLMPLIPFIGIYGVYGTGLILKRLNNNKLPVLARWLPVVLGLAVLVSLLNGALTYRADVKLINDEQVRIGQWLRDNTPKDAIVASHDIGAIGYFSKRRLVDTAGLISPEFIPIVLNQKAILDKLKAERVNYFALYADWYPELFELLDKEGRKVFQPDETYLAVLGEENMAVFFLR